MEECHESYMILKQHGKIIEKWENYAWKHNHKKNLTLLIYLSFLIKHAYNYIMISFINSFIKLIKEIRVKYLKTRQSEPRMHANLLWCFDLFLDLWSFTLKIKKDLFCSKNEDHITIVKCVVRCIVLDQSKNKTKMFIG